MNALLGDAWKFTFWQSDTEISFGLMSQPDDAVAATDTSGTGLGKIQRIVTRHQGQIWAESAPGEDANFFFALGSNQPNNKALADVIRY